MRNSRSVGVLYFLAYFLLALTILFSTIFFPTDIIAYSKEFVSSIIMLLREGSGSEISPNYSEPKQMTDEANTNQNNTDRHFLSYRNLDLGIETRYPSNWSIEHTVDDSIIFRSPREDINDYLQDYLEFDIFPTSDLTIDEAVEVGEDNALLPNYTIVIPSVSKTFAGNPAKIMVFSYMDYNYGEIVVMKVAIQNNDNFYLMRYSAEATEFLNYLPVVIKIIDSMKIAPPLYYENFDIGLRVKYPSDWVYSEGDELLEESPLSVDFHPKEKILSTYPLSLEIFLDTENVDTSLDEAVNQTIKDHMNKDGFHLISSSAVPNLIDENIPSQMLNFSFQLSDFLVINATEIITIKNGKEYHFLYQAEKEEYLKYPIVNQIIDSLELVDILRYEKLFDDNSGVMLQYPNEYPWEIKENQSVAEGKVGNRTIELIEDSYYNLTLSVFPYHKSLENLKNESFDYYRQSKLRFDILSQKATLIDTTGNRSMMGYNATFTYYDPSLEQDVKGIHIYSKNKDTVYIVSFTSSLDFYDLYLTSVIKMVDSFKIIEPLPVPSENDFPYYPASYGFKFRHPSNWVISDNGSVVTLQTVNSSVWLQIATIPSYNINFYEYIENVMRDIIEFNLGNIFEFSALNLTKGNEPRYQVEYRTGDTKNLDNFLLDERGTIYDIYYYADDVNEYYNNMPIIRKIIESLEVPPNFEPRALAGFSVGKGPAGIAINPKTDRLYVANGLSNTVSVLNSTNNELIKEIEVGNAPHGIAVNPNINMVYVANVDSSSVSVIDALRNTRIKDIEVGPDPLMVSVNPFSHMVYVADGSSHDVYVIDGSSNELVTNVTTGGRTNSLSGVGLAINHFTNKIYVTNPITGNVTVIDGNTNHILEHIPLGPDAKPVDITVNPFTNIAYIIESGYRYPDIAAIDLSQNTEIGFRSFNGSLTILALNPFTNRLYATDGLLDAVYIIDTGLFEEPDRHSLDILRVDSAPWGIAVNPNTNIVYVANSYSNTVATINGTENKLLFGVKFDIYDGSKDYEIFGHKIPVNSSKQVVINCNGVNILGKDYINYNNGRSVKCEPHAKNAFAPIVSAFWSGMDSSPPVEFNVTRHGVLTGAFFDLSNVLQALGLTISIMVLASIVFAASVPSILGKVRKVTRYW